MQANARSAGVVPLLWLLLLLALLLLCNCGKYCADDVTFGRRVA